MGIRFYNLNGFFVKKLAHGVNYTAYITEEKKICQAKLNISGRFEPCSLARFAAAYSCASSRWPSCPIWNSRTFALSKSTSYPYASKSSGDRSMIRCSPKTRRKALLRYRRSKRIVNHCVSSSGSPLFFDFRMQADFNCNFLKLIICGISYIYDDFYLIFPGKKYILQMIFHGIVLLWDMCYLTTVIFQQIR